MYDHSMASAGIKELKALVAMAQNTLRVSNQQSKSKKILKKVADMTRYVSWVNLLGQV